MKDSPFRLERVSKLFATSVQVRMTSEEQFEARPISGCISVNMPVEYWSLKKRDHSLRGGNYKSKEKESQDPK